VRREAGRDAFAHAGDVVIVVRTVVGQ
jgi:hypothetical protein